MSAELHLDSIAIDCTDPVSLAEFYAGLFGVESRGDFFYLPDGKTEIWFQQVGGYQPPTWPTQERGQQAHFDINVPDIEAGIERAVNLGATLTERRPEMHYPVLLDPAGHPFCLVTDDEVRSPSVDSLCFDAKDHRELAEFYQQLCGGVIEADGDWIDLPREGGLHLSFQQVENYQPPTWPTQERGQQIHIDFHTTDREAHVGRAESLGAGLLEVNQRFTVMLDPAGHPFCICDKND